MLGSLALVGAGLAVASLPYWLPPAVVALRVRIFGNAAAHATRRPYFTSSRTTRQRG